MIAIHFRQHGCYLCLQFSAERDGYVEKRVKHTITVTGDDDISDQVGEVF